MLRRTCAVDSTLSKSTIASSCLVALVYTANACNETNFTTINTWAGVSGATSKVDLHCDLEALGVSTDRLLEIPIRLLPIGQLAACLVAEVVFSWLCADLLARTFANGDKGSDTVHT